MNPDRFGPPDIFYERLRKSPDSKNYWASAIFNYLTKKTAANRPIDVGHLEHRIYDYMIFTKSPDEMQKLLCYDTLLESCADIIGSESQIRKYEELGYKSEFGDFWFYVYPDGNKASDKLVPKKRLKNSSDVSVAVDFKEYFTFAPVSTTYEGVCKEIEMFYRAVPKIVEYAARIGSQLNECIQVKVPCRPTDLLRHADSIVIHYRDKRSSGAVREIVRDAIGPLGIYVGRKTDERTRSGFDFSSQNSDYDGSHSELVSRQVARLIKQHILDRKSSDNPFFNPFSNLDNFLRYLDANIYSVGSMHDSSIHEYHLFAS